MTIWTSVRDQKLFLLYLKHAKIDHKTIASEWKAEYVDTGIDSYEPTAKAIKEHIESLGKGLGSKSTTANGTPKAKAAPRATKAATQKATPKKSSSALIKIPKSSGKRKRPKYATSDDDDLSDLPEEDPETERAILKTTPSAQRSTLSRRSKNVAKSYNQDDDEETSRATGGGGEDEQRGLFLDETFDRTGSEPYSPETTMRNG